MTDLLIFGYDFMMFCLIFQGNFEKNEKISNSKLQAAGDYARKVLIEEEAEISGLRSTIEALKLRGPDVVVVR